MMSQTNTFEGQSVNGLTTTDANPIPAPDGFVDESVQAALSEVRTHLAYWNNNRASVALKEIDDDLNHLLNLPSDPEVTNLVGELTMFKNTLLNQPEVEATAETEVEDAVVETPADDTPFEADAAPAADPIPAEVKEAVQNTASEFMDQLDFNNVPNTDELVDQAVNAVTEANSGQIPGVTVEATAGENPGDVTITVSADPDVAPPSVIAAMERAGATTEPEVPVEEINAEVVITSQDVIINGESISTDELQAPPMTQELHDAIEEVGLTPQEPVQKPVVENPDILSNQEIEEERAEDDEEVIDSVAALQEEESTRMEAATAKSDDGDYTAMSAAFMKAAENKAAKGGDSDNELVFDFQFNKRAMRKPGIMRVDEMSDKKDVVVSYALINMLRDYARDGELPRELSISGVKININDYYGAYEEGGSDGTSGAVMLVTDPEGRKIPPLTVYSNGDHVNGRHAMMPVTTGYYVLLGGWSDDYEIVGIYRIVGFRMVKTNNGREYPKIDVELVGYTTDGENINTIVDKYTVHQPLEDHALDAAFDRMHEENATTPCYVRDYRPYYPNYNDIEACTKDKKLRKQISNASCSLEEAYEAVGQVLGDQIAAGITKEQFPLMYLIFNYRPQYSCLMGYLIGVLYDASKKSSAGNRLIYKQFLLQPGDSFYYPDKDPDQAVLYDRMAAAAADNQGFLASVFRRMTK